MTSQAGQKAPSRGCCLTSWSKARYRSVHIMSRMAGSCSAHHPRPYLLRRNGELCQKASACKAIHTNGGLASSGL